MGGSKGLTRKGVCFVILRHFNQGFNFCIIHLQCCLLSCVSVFNLYTGLLKNYRRAGKELPLSHLS